jgi:sensor histidine kinase YesM
MPETRDSIARADHEFILQCQAKSTTTTTYRLAVITILCGLASAIYYFGVNIRDNSRDNTKAIVDLVDTMKSIKVGNDQMARDFATANNVFSDALNKLTTRMGVLEAAVNRLEEKKR